MTHIEFHKIETRIPERWSVTTLNYLPRADGSVDCDGVIAFGAYEVADFSSTGSNSYEVKPRIDFERDLDFPWRRLIDELTDAYIANAQHVTDLVVDALIERSGF